jgi:sec-independent protein translocase protein TatC
VAPPSTPAAKPSFPPPGTLPSGAPPPAAKPGLPGGTPPPPPSKTAESPDEHAMTLWEHLAELRSRIIRMMGAFAIGAVCSWIYRADLLHWLTTPLIEGWPKSLPGPPNLVFLSPHALFFSYVRIAALGGLVFSLPFILYQIWAFIAPGLYSREKKFAVPFVFSSCGLFAAGGWFGWRVAFPVAFTFLLGMATDPIEGIKIEPNLTVSDYIEFVTHMLLAFGLMSELPVLVFFLSVAGLVNHRHLIKFFRYFIVVAFVIAAIITPPDPMSQLLLAVPLTLLYGVSIGVAYLFGKKETIVPFGDKKP